MEEFGLFEIAFAMIVTVGMWIPMYLIWKIESGTAEKVMLCGVILAVIAMWAPFICHLLFGWSMQDFLQFTNRGK